MRRVQDIRGGPLPNKIDPAVPLTWPLRWHYWWNMEQVVDDHGRPYYPNNYKWSVVRHVPDHFNDSQLLIVCRSGIQYPEFVATGHAANWDAAVEAIQTVLHGVNLELEEYYLRPRIEPGARSSSGHSGTYTPTPGGRP